MLAGTRPYSALDGLAMVVALVGVSVPVFWLGLLFIYLFAVRLAWLPAIGSGSWRHLVMPALALAMFLVAAVARQTRSSVLEVARQQYVATARAKGLAEASVIRRHMLKNALIPVVTVAGVLFGRTLGGSVLTETVFAYPGMGRLLIEAILARDYHVVQGAILVFATAFVFVNILVDVVYCLLDPRISLSVGVISTGIGLGVGVLIGAPSGFQGGAVDLWLMRLVDVMLAFPTILLAIIVVVVLGPGLRNAMIAVGMAQVPVYARLARALVLKVREEEFVAAATALGCSWPRILGATCAQLHGAADSPGHPHDGRRDPGGGRPGIPWIGRAAAHP